MAKAAGLKNAIKVQVLNSPAIANPYKNRYASFKENEKDYFITTNSIYYAWETYAGSNIRNMDDLKLFPLNAKDVSGLPPAVIFTFEFDPFRDEGAAYAEKLRKAGVRVMYRCFPGLVHVGAGIPADAPENQEMYEIIKATMKQALVQ